MQCIPFFYIFSHLSTAAPIFVFEEEKKMKFFHAPFPYLLLSLVSFSGLSSQHLAGRNKSLYHRRPPSM